MKRSPLRRKTELSRGPGPKQVKGLEPKTRLTRSSKQIASRSAKRIAERPLRDEVRRIVTESAGHQCQYAAIIPEVGCGWLPDRHQLEVNELRGGSRRGTEYLDPLQCRLTCPMHHEWVTDHKKEANHRLAAYENRECPFCPCSY